MISRSRIAVVLALVGCFAHLTAREARAADPRLVRVVLLRVADRMSLALEMTGEPQKAALRVLSSRALEIEAGPVSGFFKEEQLAPASEGAFIRQVSIQKYTNANRVAFVRARVMFDAPGAGNVRVVGRTVYVDLAPMVAFRPVLPRAPRLERRENPPQGQQAVRAQPKSAPPNSYEAVRRAAEISSAEQLRTGGSAGAGTVDGNRSVPGVRGENPCRRRAQGSRRYAGGG